MEGNFNRMMKWNDKVQVDIVPANRPSVDRVRLIRRSIRCGWFGFLGLIPVIGLGLAVQAVRLHRQINSEQGTAWEQPAVSWPWLVYWLAAMAGVGACSRLAGFELAAGVFASFVGVYFGVRRVRTAGDRRRARFWHLPLVGEYWVVGLLFMWIFAVRFGVASALAVITVFLVVQSWQLWRAYVPEHGAVWNPVAHYARAGVVLGYAGIFISLGCFGVAALCSLKLAGTL